jgi:DNA-binding NarL/FixJ family response regulator
MDSRLPRLTAVALDTSASFRMFLRVALAKIGVDVVAEASEGEAAFDLYEKHRPNLVVMDVALDGLDGVRAAERLLAHYPNATVVMCSTRVIRSEVQACQRAGVAHFLMKPVTAARVQDIVGSLLRRVRRWHQAA